MPKTELKETDEVAALRAELETMKGRQKARSRYGASLTDSQADEIAKREKAEAAGLARRAADAERAQAEAITRRKRIAEEAQRLVSKGRLRIAVAGVRVDSITSQLEPPCPHCGGGLDTADAAILEYTSSWIDTPPGDRFSSTSPLMVYSARNPLSRFMGSPLWVGPTTCKACKKNALVAVELVVL